MSLKIMSETTHVISHLFLLGYLVCVILVIKKTSVYTDKRKPLSYKDLNYCLNAGGIGLGLLIISVILILSKTP